MANELIKAYQGMKSGPSMGLYRHITESENLIEAKNREKRNRMIKLLTTAGEGIDKKFANWQKAKSVDDSVGGFLDYTLKSGKSGKYKDTHLKADEGFRPKTMFEAGKFSELYTRPRDALKKLGDKPLSKEEKTKKLEAGLLEHVNKRKAKDKNELARTFAGYQNMLKPNKGRKGVNVFKDIAGALKGEFLTPDPPERKGTIYKPEYEHGGMVKGKDHDQGGVKIEVEGGEFIFPEDVVRKVGVGFFNRLLKMLKGGKS